MSRITVKEYSITIPRLPASFRGYRIVQISDIHLGRGRFTEPLLKKLATLQADMLVLTGDVLEHLDYLPLLRPFLSRLIDTIRPADGFYGVWGNHDSRIAPAHVEGLPIRWLMNEATQIRRGSDLINIIGVDQKKWAPTNLLASLTNVVPEHPKILLAHFPSTAYLLNGVFDLVLAGHTHAGQVRIPGLPCATNDDIPWQQASGLSTLGKTQLFISPGIGYSGPISARLFAPSEISILQLQ